MELHIYREGKIDRIVKDQSKESILYYIEAPYKYFSSPPKLVYRGRPPNAAQIATINANRQTCTITLPGLRDVIIDYPGVLHSKSKFNMDGRQFAWKSDQQLIEVESGKVLARFDRTMLAIHKKGVLTIYGDGMGMVDVIVITAIAMQYQWEEKRR